MVDAFLKSRYYGDNSKILFSIGNFLWCVVSLVEKKQVFNWAVRSNTASCCKTRFSPSPPPLPYFRTVKANSEENKTVLDDVQRTDQIKVSLWFIGYGTHFPLKMSLLVVNVWKKWIRVSCCYTILVVRSPCYCC